MGELEADTEVERVEPVERVGREGRTGEAHVERASEGGAGQHAMLDAFPIAAELWDGDGRLHHLNPSARELYAAQGRDPDAALGGSQGPFDHLELVDQFGQPLAPADLPTAACLADGELHAGTIGVRSVGDRRPVSPVLDHRWFHLRAAPVPLPDGSQGVVATSLEVTRQYHLEEELRRAALHDPVTGLGNLRLLTLRHAQSQAAAERAGTLLGVVAVEVHGLGATEGTGPATTEGAGPATAEATDAAEVDAAAVDRVLGLVGQRLATVTRTADTAARTGPSSFAVLCTEVADAEDVRAAAARIAEALSTPTDPTGNTPSRPSSGDETPQVHTSLGWVIVDPTMALTTALHRADRARHMSREPRDLG